jgi:hypothetical protein
MIFSAPAAKIYRDRGVRVNRTPADWGSMPRDTCA